MVKRPYRFWYQNDIDFLKQHYNSDGAKFCAKYLGCSITRIISKANEIGLRRNRTRNREIVIRLSDHKAIAVCPKHGKTLHYFGYTITSLQCALCIKDNHYKWRHSNHGRAKRQQYQLGRKNDPLNNYASRLRSRLNYYKSLGKIAKVTGCFQYLPFAPEQLYDYLETIRLDQNNQCPICNINYNESGYHIDHIIPLASANSADEIWSLFDLSNLSLLCPQCNFKKGARVSERSI